MVLRLQNAWRALTNKHCMVIVCDYEEEYADILSKLSILYDSNRRDNE
jgi:hypothetical protein